MRVVLLEAHDAERSTLRFAPMGIAYLAAWLERHAPEWEVVLAADTEAALALAPDVVGVSAVTPNFPEAIRIAAQVRAVRSVPLVLGGPHITGLPASLPEAFTCGVLGEGEETLQELVTLCRLRGGVLPADDLARVPGLVYHAPEGPRLTGTRPCIQPLDRIPPPRRHPVDTVADGLWSFSSRGCPYRCRFCSTAEFWASYRMHSARYCIDALNDLIHRFDIRCHCFMDDLFAVHIARLEEIAALMHTDLVRPLELTATVRADLVSTRMADLLAEVGVRWCHLGLESGSDAVLQWLKRETTTVARNQQALDILAPRGLAAVGSFIIGAPGEGEGDLQATYDFIRRNLDSGRLLSFTFGPLVAFPGTAAWTDAVARGVIKPGALDWKAFDIDIRTFDPERYVLLSSLPRARFVTWFERFRNLWEEARSDLPRRVQTRAQQTTD